jgi:hypothetical protein
MFQQYRKGIVVWLIIAGVIIAAIFFRWDKKIVAAGVIAFGLMTQAFSGAFSILSAVPVVGPVIVKAVTLPFILLVNGIGYVVTFFALRRGYKLDVMKSRFIIGMFLAGTLLGFILGRLF